jgi:Mannosyltransferase (PIG-V)
MVERATRKETDAVRAPDDAKTWGRRQIAWSLRTRQLDGMRLRRGDWLYIVTLFLLTRALVLVLGILGSAMFPEVAQGNAWSLDPILGQGLDAWMRVYVHFDSGWYLGISDHYLLSSSGNPNWLREWAFFPLYPWVLHPVAVVLHVLHVPGNVAEIAGVLVSHVALFGALVYLYRLVCGELNTQAAQRAVTYLLIFPASLFLSAVYPEGLFTLLSVGAFYHARRRQWAVAGLMAAGAVLTRGQGIFLLFPLILEFAAAHRARHRWLDANLYTGLWLGLPLVALVGYALYSHALTGYWLAFSTSASNVWGRRLTPPIYPLVRYVLAPTLGSAFNFDFASLNFAVAVGFLILGVVAWRRLPAMYAVWLWIGVLVPLSSGGHQLTSLTRYVAPLFPAFVALAAWSLRLRWTPDGLASDEGTATSASAELRDRIIVVPSLLLMGLFVVMFTNGAFGAA